MFRDHLFWLSDAAWKAIEPHLPYGRRGEPRVDDRRVISGILHVLKTGCRWRDVPAEYGPTTTICNRYHRWSRRQIWQRIFQRMAAAGPVPEDLSLDSSHIKAHRSVQTTKRGRGRKRLVHRVAEERQKSMHWPMIKAALSPSPCRREMSPTSPWPFRSWRDCHTHEDSWLTKSMMPTSSADG